MRKRVIIITITTTTNNQIQGSQPACQLNQCSNNVDELHCGARACVAVIKMRKRKRHMKGEKLKNCEIIIARRAE